MAHLSRKKLLVLLDKVKKKVKNISYETYGRNTHAYIDMGNRASRAWLEQILIVDGQKVNREYFPGSSIVDVRVSYFKAKGWDE